MIKEKLKELRIEKNYKQANLAKKLNLTPSTISDWERGRSEPNVSQLIALANNYGCTIDYIVGRENEDGTIYIMGNELSKSENQLLDMVRQLHEDDKDIVYKLVESILLSYKAKK